MGAPLRQNNRLVRPRRTTNKSCACRLWGVVARLFAWYTIFTVFFRCPATPDQLMPESPAVCKPYFSVKEVIAPHVEPYYVKYAEPYVEVLRPYYDGADRVVITPIVAFAAPKVEAAGDFVTQKFDVHVKPVLSQYETIARAQYNEKVHPIVRQASEIVSPYVAVATAGAKKTYSDVLAPAYVAVSPYAVEGYEVVADFAREKVGPGVRWAAGRVGGWVDGNVWPLVKVVYGEYVEPQLARIGERLGRYGGKQSGGGGSHKVKTTHRVPTTGEAKPSSFVKPPQQLSSKTATSSSKKANPTVTITETKHKKPAATQTVVGSGHLGDFKPSEPIEAPEPSDDESEVRHDARLEVAADLKEWQERFTKAADEGAAEIDSLIHDITEEILSSPLMQIGHDALTKLEEVKKNEIAGLKKNILMILNQKQYYPAVEDFDAEVKAFIRSAGLPIKEQASEIRYWREEFETQLQAAITIAADAHFKTLETMRDLALQKIGMKWAWMDGITYKDWAKYHELRDRFDAWTDDLKAMIVTHSELRETQDFANSLEDKAMDITKATITEINQIKKVASTKYLVADIEDDWDEASVKKRAEEIAQKKLDEAVKAVVEKERKEREERLRRLAEEKALAKEEVKTQVDADVPEVEPEFRTQVDPEVPTAEAEAAAEVEATASIQTVLESEVTSVYSEKAKAKETEAAVKEMVEKVAGKDEL